MMIDMSKHFLLLDTILGAIFCLTPKRLNEMGTSFLDKGKNKLA